MDKFHAQQGFTAKGLNLTLALGILVLGGLSFYIPIIVSASWIVVFFLCFYGFLTHKINWTWYSLAASPMLEVLVRLTRAPFIPYETGKYFLLFALVLLFIHQQKIKAPEPAFKISGWLLLLLLPGLIVSISVFNLEDWVFNAFGILELAFLLFIASRERMQLETFCKTLRFGLLPILAILGFLTVKSPGFSEVSFSLSANYTAAGFGTNQVATALGAGIVLTVLLLILNYPIFSFKWISYLLLAWLLFRGLLTFSRGGMIGAGLAVFIAIIPAMFSSFRSFLRYTALIICLVISGTFVFMKINDMTGGKLLLRYQGETAGTYEGTRNKTLNTITSGRSDLIKSDIAIFRENPWFGVGPGGAKDLHVKYGAVENSAAHTEFARLLSEHGVGGLLVAIVLTVFPLVWIRRQNIMAWKGIAGGLFMLAIFTSFHSAMRTNITVVYYSLAAMPVVLNVQWFRKKEKQPVE
jgi:O-antigen ligase